MPALDQVAAQRREEVPGLLVLDALGDDLEVQVRCEVDDGPDDRGVLAAWANPVTKLRSMVNWWIGSRST